MARAAREYDAFVADLDYGYDVARMAIDWSPGRPLVVATSVAVEAGRGWQNTGLTLEAGGRCRIVARGRVRLGEVRDPTTRAVTPIESEADGITLRWYRGRPVGRLLVAQWVEADGQPPGFVVLGAGSTSEIAAAVTGPLYARVNEPPGDLGDSVGSFSVDVMPPL
jgi:hypothetical protein